LVRNKKNVLKIENLRVSYGAVKALKGVSLEVNEGEIVTLIGANGGGKSTLLETILGMHRVSDGRIQFMDKDITGKPTDKIVGSGICLIPEGRGIFPLMTVLENLQLGAYHLEEDIGGYLGKVNQRFPVLSKRSKQMAGTLSGGEQQMLSIGRGLMSVPKLMMLDEPSLGLAPVMVEELFRTIVDLNKEGYTILLAEQNARKALTVAHHGYVLEIGNIVLSGDTDKLASDARVREAYLGGVSLSKGG
jgi:branched-chain amino acid transport system ATP-binding protein